MTVTKSVTDSNRLAIDGGEPALKHPVPARYPGAMLYGAEECAAIATGINKVAAHFLA